MTWEGSFRPPLVNVTTEPRPYQQTIPIWHGSASSKQSTELAAKNGCPIFSSNTFHRQDKYKALIDHYRERWAYYGRDPKEAIVGAGSGGLYLADTKEEAIARYRPYYEAHNAAPSSQYNRPPFKSLEDKVENGSVLVGSADSVIEKILDYHEAFGNQVLAVSVDGLTKSEQREQLERFARDIAPVLRRELPDSVWEKRGALRTNVDLKTLNCQFNNINYTD